MNLPKPAFAAVLVAWLLFAGAYGIVNSARGMEPLLSWMGLALCGLGPLFFVVSTSFFRLPQTRKTALGCSILCGLGLAMTLAMSYRYGPVAGNAHIWAGVTLMAWLAYLRWFNHIPGG